jgi:uncharacterized Ntn-hydrolase superfamily protein
LETLNELGVLTQESVMTFTIVARCERTGMLGIGTATSALAVGVRVPHVRARLGAVAVMAHGEERLGHLGIKLLEMGHKAFGVVEQLATWDPYAEYRQLGVVDDDGLVAARTGERNRDWSGHRLGDGYVVLGNHLSGERVLDAMEEAFEKSPGEQLEERLMLCIEAGRDAGGEPGGQRSAALLVYDDKDFARVNLRVDVHQTPEIELRRVLEEYRPTITYYTLRQVDPTIPTFAEWLAASEK